MGVYMYGIGGGGAVRGARGNWRGGIQGLQIIEVYHDSILCQKITMTNQMSLVTIDNTHQPT